MYKLFGFIVLLYICLSVGLPLCKLLGILGISWGLALSPLWIPIVFIYVVVLVMFIGILFNSKFW